MATIAELIGLSSPGFPLTFLCPGQDQAGRHEDDRRQDCQCDHERNCVGEHHEPSQRQQAQATDYNGETPLQHLDCNHSRHEPFITQFTGSGQNFIHGSPNPEPLEPPATGSLKQSPAAHWMRVSRAGRRLSAREETPGRNHPLNQLDNVGRVRRIGVAAKGCSSSPAVPRPRKGAAAGWPRLRASTYTTATRRPNGHLVSALHALVAKVDAGRARLRR